MRLTQEAALWESEKSAKGYGQSEEDRCVRNQTIKDEIIRVSGHMNRDPYPSAAERKALGWDRQEYPVGMPLQQVVSTAWDDRMTPRNWQELIQLRRQRRRQPGTSVEEEDDFFSFEMPMKSEGNSTAADLAPFTYDE